MKIKLFVFMNNRNLIIRIHELNTHFNYYSIRGSNIFFCNNSPLFEYQQLISNGTATALELAFDRRRSRLAIKMIRYTVRKPREIVLFEIHLRPLATGSLELSVQSHH